jgi:molybdate transport system substrate-binding protein
MRRAPALIFSVVLVLLAALAGCSAGSQPVNLTVLGASSLKTALDQVKAQYEAAHTGTTLTISTGASSALKTQIDQGVAADLFLSADATNPQALADAGHTDGGPEPFASNVLAIIVPDGNPAGIASPADLARPGLRIVGAGDDVPITKYANQAVDKMAALPGYPSGFVEAYHANIVSREENVGAVTSKIDLGEGDAAIVYVTDAKTGGLQTIDIPPEVNVLASYNGVVLKKSANTAAARTLFDWIKGSAGQKILTDLGFLSAQ